MSHSYGTYLEELRKSRNIPPQEFVDGIMSYRQYRRYINNECSIPNDKFTQLVERLSINIATFINGYDTKVNFNSKRINEVYSEIRQNRYGIARAKLEQIEVETLSTKYLNDFYNYCKISIDFETNNKSYKKALHDLKELISFPDCFNNQTLNFVDLISLLKIVQINDSNVECNLIGKYLFKHLTADINSILGESRFILPSIYSVTCRLLFRNAEYNKCLRLSLKGIEFCNKYELNSSLKNLFLYSALSYTEIKMYKESNSQLDKLNHLVGYLKNIHTDNYYLQKIKELKTLNKLKEGL